MSRLFFLDCFSFSYRLMDLSMLVIISWLLCDEPCVFLEIPENTKRKKYLHYIALKSIWGGRWGKTVKREILVGENIGRRYFDG